MYYLKTKQNIASFILVILLLTVSNLVKAQNEAFHGGAGDGSAMSELSVNFNDVSYVGDDLTVVINRAEGQADTTNTDTVRFSVVFSEAVLEFTTYDLALGGTSLPKTAKIAGSGTNFIVSVTDMWSNGTVILNIPSGNVKNSVGNPNKEPTFIDNDVFYTGAPLNIEITRANGQTYVTNSDTVHFNANFSGDVSDFESADVQFGGTSNPTNVAITGSDQLFDIAVSGMQNDGDITINIPANVVQNNYGKPNKASINTENSVLYDISRPDVEINLSNGQSDPAYSLPLKFNVTFSEEVLNFSEESISYGGSPGITLAVSGSGSNYNVIIDGIVSNETVTINIPEGAAYDYVGNTNTNSNNIHNSITFLGVTGINDKIENSATKVYCKDNKIIVSFEDTPQQNILLEIYNLKGQKVLSQIINSKINYIPIELLKAYIIRLSGEGFTYYKKIITL